MTDKIQSAKPDITFCLSQCQDLTCGRNMDGKIYRQAMKYGTQVSCVELAGGCNDFKGETQKIEQEK